MRFSPGLLTARALDKSVAMGGEILLDLTSKGGGAGVSIGSTGKDFDLVFSFSI